MQMRNDGSQTSPATARLEPGARTVEQISSVAFGFMASKAMFVALHLELFDKLRAGPRPVSELATECLCSEQLMRKVVAANVATGLLVLTDKQGPVVENSPAAAKFLVHGAPGDCGDYYRHQIDKQIWPVLSRLDASLASQRSGTNNSSDMPSHWYEVAMADPHEATLFTESQHAGSLGAAIFLARKIQIPNSDNQLLLDIAGGSGAFSIALCQQNPNLRSVLIDFPQVAKTAENFVHEAGLQDRVSCVGGNAITDPWLTDDVPTVVLLSYLLSAVKEQEMDTIIRKAFHKLQPGGLLVIHDFILDESATGPQFAALWLFTHEAITPGSPTLTGSLLTSALQKHGFVDIEEKPALPDITSFVFARKPGLPTAYSGCQRGTVSFLPDASGRSLPGPVQFQLALKVRYGECDMQGVVFNAHYLSWVDEATDQFMRSVLGQEYEKVMPLEYMVKKAEIVYVKPARHNDTITMTVSVPRWGTTSCTVHVSSVNQNGEECFNCNSVLVFVHPKNLTPVAPSSQIKSRIMLGSKL